MSYGPPPSGAPPGWHPGAPSGGFATYPGQNAPPPGQGMPAPGVSSPSHQGMSPFPQPQQSLGVPSTVQDTVGSFEGANFRIDHRDSNSILQLTLQPNYTIKGKPGAMVAMSGSVQIKGKMKFSFSKMMTGGDMSESIFTGPGDIILAPEIWGDIVPINVQPNVQWSVGKDAYLASTAGVVRSTKSQGFMKGFMSGEGFFIAQVTGQGILFVQSIGAIIKRDLQPNEEWIVDNGHLVAWSAPYTIERIQTSGGGLFSGSHTGEGAVCRFRGPGTVYIQTRNPESLGQWIAAQIPSQGS